MQEAVDRLLSGNQRAKCHLQIGQTILAEAKQAAAVDERIIDVIQHLNQGRAQLDLPVEKVELAHLNLTANKKAKASAAFEQAYAFCKTGLSLLPKNCWQTHYQLTLTLHDEAIEAAYLVGDFDRVESYFRIMLENATSHLDKINAYASKIKALMSDGQFAETAKIGLQALKLFQLELPLQPSQQEIEAEIAAVRHLLSQKTPTEILQLPQQNDPNEIAIHRLLATIATPAFHVYHDLHILLITKLTHLSLLNGHSKYTSVGYCFFGGLFAGDSHNMKIANQMTTVALALQARLNSKELQTYIDFLSYSLLKPWSTNLNEVIQRIRESIRAGKENGDVEFTSRLICFYSTFGILCGKNLESLHSTVRADNTFLIRHGGTAYFGFNEFFRQCILNLLGKSSIPYVLVGEGYDEIRDLERDMSSGHGNLVVLYGLFKTVLCFMFEQYDEAIEYATRANVYIKDVAGMLFLAILPFYEALSLLAVYSDQKSAKKKRTLAKVTEIQERILGWAEHAPGNHLHKYWLVEAEKARVLGQDQEAAEYYDKAIALAGEHGYVNDEALANELAARFYASRDRPRFTEVYIREAYRLYDQWGAKSKTDHLIQKYSQWLKQIPDLQDSHPEAAPFDIDTLVRTTQTFTDTPLVGDMLQNLMKIVMENAGAQRGLLLLQKHGQWMIEAEATLDPVNVQVLQSVPINATEAEPVLAQSIVQYAIRTKQNVLLDHASEDPVFRDDPYIQNQKSQSVLCLPILYQSNVLALLYLENNLTRGAFTTQRIQTLNLVASQIAISLHNTLQYEEQFQTVQFLYQLRTSLEEAQTTNHIITQTGKLLLKNLKHYPLIGIHIRADNYEWQHNITPEAERFQHSQDIVWGDQKRGQLHIYSNTELEQSAQNVFVAETAALLSRTLEARELQMRLLQSARLVSLGEMAAGVAHELNQPLAGISAIAEDYFLRLQDNIPITEDQFKDVFKRILGTVDRMSNTVEHLRVFSRDTSQEPGNSLDLNDVIHSCLDIIGMQLKNCGIDVVLDLAEGLPKLVGHPYQLEQIFLNLLGNARDAFDAKISNTPFFKRITIHTYLKDNNIIADVEDNGMGIAPENIERIFEPFFTTKEAKEGTGLGLSITYAIVKNHGGHITCNSCLDHGTQFCLTLPILT